MARLPGQIFWKSIPEFRRFSRMTGNPSHAALQRRTMARKRRLPRDFRLIFRKSPAFA